MGNNGSLGEFFELYTQGKWSKKELEGAILECVLRRPRLFYLQGFLKDERIDFLSWLYGRLSNAIGNYRRGTDNFAGYIISMIRYSAREYRRYETEHRLVERVYWEAVSEDMMVCNAEPAYQEEISPPPVRREPIPNPRQVLILLLKSYSEISEDFISRAAPALGIGGDSLQELVDRLREMRLDQDTFIRALRDRIYCQYFRCRSFERRLGAAPEGSGRRIMLQRRLERARKRLENMKVYIKTLKIEASNRQIAKLLGIPKGTVDSTLFAAKRGAAGPDNAPGEERRRGRPRLDGSKP